MRGPHTRDGAAANREPYKLNVGRGRKQEEIEMGWMWDKQIVAQTLATSLFQYVFSALPCLGVQST